MNKLLLNALALSSVLFGQNATACEHGENHVCQGIELIKTNANTVIKAPPKSKNKSFGATFDVTYVGTFTQQARDAFDKALEIIGNEISSTQVIKVRAEWKKYPDKPSTLASCKPAYVYTIPNGLPNVYYPSSLADKLQGYDIDPSGHDVFVYINEDADWSYELTETPVLNKPDMVTVLLHEMLHGFGISGSATTDSTTGSVPYITIYDQLIRTQAGDHLSVLNGTQLNQMMTSSSDLFLTGAIEHGNGNQKVLIHTPSIWKAGSSFYHYDEASFPPGHENSLMTPSVYYAEVNWNIGNATRGLFQDMGWTSSNVTTYNIGNNPTDDFASIHTAIAAFEQTSHSGFVQFVLNGDLFQEQFLVRENKGATQMNFVAGQGYTPVVQVASATPLNLRNADHVTFEGITFKTTLANAAKLIQIDNSKDISFVNCTIEGADNANANSSQTIGFDIDLVDGTYDNISFDNVVVRNVFQAISFNGNDVSERAIEDQNENIVIKNSQFSSFGILGSIANVNGLKIQNSKFSSRYSGLNLVYDNGNILIERNQFTAGTGALTLRDVNEDAGEFEQTALLINNYLFGGSIDGGLGLSLKKSFLRVFNNTISANGMLSGTAIYTENSGIVVQNSIIHSPGDGYAMNFQNSGIYGDMKNNNIFSPELPYSQYNVHFSAAIKFNTVTYPLIADFEAVFSPFINNTDENPLLGSGDQPYYAGNPNLVGTGSEGIVSLDIEGNGRPTNPTIGCWEFDATRITSDGLFNALTVFNENGETYPCSIENAQLSFDFPDRICLNDWVSFWNTSSWQFNKFEWFVNGEKVSSSNGFGKKFSEAGTYLISLIGSINGTDCKQGIYTYVTIQAPLDIVGPTQVCPESEGVIYELVGGEDLNTINWSFWGGASTLTPNHDELTIDFGKWISNSDNIVASYSDKNGCLNQTIFDININCEQPLPSASLQGLALEVNPNPIASNSVLGFKYEEEAPVNVQLYDMNGKLIADLFNQNQFIGQGRIELGSIFNQIESGVYLIKLSNGSTVKSIQIVK